MRGKQRNARGADRQMKKFQDISCFRFLCTELYCFLEVLAENNVRAYAKTLCRFFDLLSCLSDQYKITHFAVKSIQPFIVAGAFVITAADQKGRTVHRLDALDRSIRVGSLGIVVISDTIFLCDIFNSVFYCCKLTDALTDTLYRHACIVCHCNCCHHILKVMLSQKFQFSCMYERNLRFCGLEYDQISVQINSLVKFPYA